MPRQENIEQLTFYDDGEEKSSRSHKSSLKVVIFTQPDATLKSGFFSSYGEGEGENVDARNARGVFS
jgi:hypothetical protein